MLAHRYEPETTALLERIILPGMRVADIGAHIGYFTRLAARRVGSGGRVFAFEPDTENRALLHANTSSYSNVEVRGEAVTDTDGTSAFYHVPQSSGCHSTVEQSGAERTEVPSTSLDTFMHMHDVASLDVIKMDIEGGEWKALLGMERALGTAKHLILEYNPDALKKSGVEPVRVIEFLRDRGFRLSVLRGRETSLEGDVAKNYLEDGSVNVHAYRP